MNLEFDYEKCTKCGLCSKSCVVRVIENNEIGKPFEKFPDSCIDCGHCVSVCPHDAVKNKRMDEKNFENVIDPKISIDQYTNIVRNRRTIRNYTKKQINPSEIDKIMNAVRYIPTGSNQQSLKYNIITDQKILVGIRDSMAKKFKMLQKVTNFFLIKLFIPKVTRNGLDQLVKLYEDGIDPFLRHTPCMIIIYSKQSYGGISSWDAGIASYNINLSAESMGIGVMMNGFHVLTSKYFKSIRKSSHIPKKHKILASMCLGYPKIKYYKQVSRKSLKINNI